MDNEFFYDANNEAFSEFEAATIIAEGSIISEDSTITKSTINEFTINESTITEIEKKNMHRSIVHNNFTLNKQTNQYKCNHCSKLYKAQRDGSTSTLKNHLKKSHANLFSKEVGPIDIFLKSENKLKFTQESWNNDLIKWIVTSDQPFTVIESNFFKTMIKRLKPEAKIFSADTIRNNIFKSFNENLIFIKNLLQEVPGQISFTLDSWTSKNQVPFLGITAHWISKDWELKSILLDFCHLEGSHSGENMSEVFFKVLKEFGILTKILGIATDNASNMNSMFNCLEQAFCSEGIHFDAGNQRIRCLAHIINLAAQEALKSLKGMGPEKEDDALDEEDDDKINVIKKLRKLVVKIRSSPQRRERFSRQCIALNINDLQLIPDIKTRWNSSFEMMKRALLLREPLHNMVSADKELKSYILSDNDWQRIEKISNLLECFQIATSEISNAHYPTLGRSVPIYNYLIDLIEDFLELQHPEDICSAAEKAKDKLQKFYPTSDGLVYIVATIMDPRLKMQYYIDNEFDDYIEMYKEKISDLWKMEYMPIQECNTTIQTTKTPNTLESHILKRRKNIQTDELDMYLNSPPLNFDTDVLSFWK
ncbi:8132_t:CDS:2, partial [Entrophospora sp. SA101]